MNASDVIDDTELLRPPEDLAEQLSRNHAHVNRVITRLQGLLTNATTARKEWFRRLLDPHRDIEKECGYPSDSQLDAWYFQRLYRQEPIANRVVNFWPEECWVVAPWVYEDENPDVETEFEAAVKDLSRHLRGNSSYAGEEGSPIWEVLERADRLCGIGHYGIVLFGLNDGLDPSMPVRGMQELNSVRKVKDENGQTEIVGNWKDGEGRVLPYQLVVNQAEDAAWSDRKLNYLRVFPEHLAQVTQWEQNPTSPRYGQPVMYLVTLADPEDSYAGSTPPASTIYVHWTRVLHVVDEKESSEVHGIPRQEPVLRRLLDLQKLYAGSAEMYWSGAFPGLSMETNPQLGGDVSIDKPGTRDALESYFNGLQRFLIGEGMTVKMLSPTVVDPTPQIKGQLEAIAIQMDVPMRILMGSERGELSSSQDARRHVRRVAKRQNRRLTPNLITPFFDRLQAYRILPTPKGYFVEWPDLESMSEQEKADIATKKTQALVSYVSGGGEALLTPMDFLTRVFGMSDQEATACIEALRQANQGADEGTGGSALTKLLGGITALIELYKAAKEGAVSEEQLRAIIQTFYGLDDAQVDALIADGIEAAREPAGQNGQANVPFLAGK